MSNATTYILVVESNPALRARLCTLLNNHQSITVAGKAESLSAALWIGEKVKHDVIFVSADLLDPTLFGVAGAYCGYGRKRKIVAYDIADYPEKLKQFRRVGVCGFLGKDAEQSEFSLAAAVVAEGGVYFSTRLVDAMFRNENRGLKIGNDFDLTNRELEILSLLANGYCNKEIANAFELSVRTVETHRFNIRRKTSASSLSDLVKVAKELDIIHLAEVAEGPDANTTKMVRALS